MKASDVIELSRWISDDKVKKEDCFKVQNIVVKALKGIKPDAKEWAFLNEVYRYTNGGGDKQDQPFKAYRRRASWGING